jgi:diguanylate cyclase (GGDEF)-like protein
MTFTSRQILQKRISLFLLFSTLIVGLTAIVVLLGWFIQSPELVQIRPQYSTMKFNTALCLLLIPIALMAIEKGHSLWATFLAGLAFVLPAAILTEYIFGVDFGIDELVVKSFVATKVQHAGRMSPNTALALLLTSGSLLLYIMRSKLHYYGEMFVALMGSLVFALGIVPLIGYIGGIESAHTWGQFTGMALHSSVCFILLGLCLIACAWKQSNNTPTWLALPIAISFMVIALSMWQAVKSYEDARFEQSMQQEADYISNRGFDRLTAFYGALDRVTKRWVISGGTPRILWDDDVREYLKAYPFLKAMEWVDSDSYLQWMEPPDGAEKLAGVKLNTEGTRADTAQLAFTTRQPQVTQAVDLLQGGKGLLYMSPIFFDEKFGGYIVSAFSLDEVFSKILMRDKNGPFYLIVKDGDNVMFNNMPAGFTPQERWQKTSTLKNKDKSWTIIVNPTPEILAKKNSALPTLILIIGMATAIFATFSVLFAFKSRQVAKSLHSSEHRLRQIIAINSESGTNDFDLNSFMNHIVHRIDSVLPVSGAVIELIEDDDMVYKAVSGTLAPFAGMRIKRAGSLSGLCTETNQVMISDDTMNDSRVNAEACKKVSARSMVVVPLSQRDKVVGVLKVSSTMPHAFTEQDIVTLQVMAGLLGGALGQELEIERRRILEDQLRHMAQYDALTGLPNRALFKDRLSHAIATNQRNKSHMAIAYLDVDHFKSINDKHGHAEGDALLKSFSARVLSVLRKTDTMARLGGDEFVLILEGLHNADDAEHIAAKINEVMQEPFELPNVTVKVGASMGVAVTAKMDINAEDILHHADEALYDVKRAGRNNFKLVVI